MTERQLDNAIDRAVHEIMDVDADARFRARVMQRLERRSTGWLGARTWVAAAAAAAVIVAVIVSWPDRRDQRPVQAGTAQERPATATARAIEAPVTETSAPAAVRERPQATQRRPVARPLPNATQVVAAGALVATVAEESAAPASVGPEAAPEAVGLEPLTSAPLQPAPIVIPPLPPVTELKIEPLFTRGPRN